MKSYKAKSVILANLGLFGPLLGPWGRNESFSEKIFYSAQLDMKIQLAVKFQKYLMDDYNAIVQTDEQTDGTDNYSPFLTNVGGLIYKCHMVTVTLIQTHDSISKPA